MRDQYRISDKENVHFGGHKTAFTAHEYRAEQNAYIYIGRFFANGRNASDEKCINCIEGFETNRDSEGHSIDIS